MPQDLAIVLAAGKGTRMKSDLPKVVHKIAGRAMIGHVLAMVHGAGLAPAVVVAPDGDAVRAEATKTAPNCQFFVQREQRGTAHAVLAARDAMVEHAGDVFVLFGDTPLVRPDTITTMRAELDAGAEVVVLAFEAQDPTGYGRVLRDDAGAVAAIREHKDASEGERAVRLCNSGVMAFRLPDVPALLDAIGTGNAQGEYYLTDAVELARSRGLRVAAATCPEDEVMGINSRAQLAAAEAVYQARARSAAMAAGVTLIAPDTVWFSYDTQLGRDVIVEPNVFFGPGVTVGDGTEIKANSHLEGATVGAGVRLGPFARLRPGARLADGVHIGNFVEVKNVEMGPGAKANHLAYLGDGKVGARANVGAGTIFCNYDGFNKNQTIIGEDAFVGSNSALVAPVTIGDGAYIGSGSVITRDVAAGDLALERTAQQVREGWARKFRERMSRRRG